MLKKCAKSKESLEESEQSYKKELDNERGYLRMLVSG